MPHRPLRFTRAVWLAVWLAAGGVAAQAPAAPPPIEHFFANPAFTGAALSPSARFLAVRIGGPAVRERLAVIDLGSNAIKVVAHFSDADIGHFKWVNDERLVFGATDKQIGQAGANDGPGLYTVKRDGADLRQLAERSDTFPTSRRRFPVPSHAILSDQRGSQDGNAVYLLSYTGKRPPELDYVSLLRLDTVSEVSQEVPRPGETRSWLLDHQGEPRVATTLEGRTTAVFYREPDGGKWRKLAEFDAYRASAGSFVPLAFGPDGTFYVTSNMGRDHTAVYAYDLAANRIADTPLVSLDGYDFSGSLIAGKNRLLGIRYVSDAEATIWFDPAMQALQKRVDALLPDTVNLITPAARAETPNLLVESYSDRQPSKYALFNTASGALNHIGETYPAIQAAQMGREELVRYPARDGLTIPAWLTLPPGSKGKNLPLVVVVHDGPHVRGLSWGWDADLQFLASRGYAVLLPEFRGSTGFGDKHYRAGWKQWGLKMQDDIADGVKWAIAQGIAAPGRICIVGPSYGGYATLMGLVNDPDLYQCGVSWIGVTDIKLMYKRGWSYPSAPLSGWKQYGLPELIGDPVKDAAQLAATSPLLQAARIKRPLLLAFGTDDPYVPLDDGKRFRDAVKAGNPDVESVFYEGEGHGWALLKTRIDFWSRVEKFLQRNIGKP